MFPRLFRRPSHRPCRHPRRGNRLRLEVLEDRLALSTYYVAVDGNNNNSGLSPTQAFATIQHGLDTAVNPGDIVSVEGGTYKEQATFSSKGNSLHSITLSNYDGQSVILNGSGLTNSDTALDIDDASYAIVTGLTIENVQNSQDAIGATIEGTSSHITLQNDTFTNIHGLGAYGIYLNGTKDANGVQSHLSHVTLSGDTLDGIASISDPGANGTYGIWLYGPTGGTPNIQNVSVSGDQIYNITTAAGNKNDDTCGIRVEGAAAYVSLSSNVIHEINGPENLSVTSPNNGMAITIYGESATAISNLTISQNTIYDSQLGTSEALTLDGNVNGFKITSNLVHDVSNIGIDCIGGDTQFDNTTPPASVNFARHGTVSHNTVYNAHSTYGGGFAAGIYVDGGRNIVLTDNITHDNDEGLEVGAENADAIAESITVSDNLIYNNTQAGLKFGGYDASAGMVENSYFVNNTVYNNDTTLTGEGQLNISDASNCVVSNNIFDAVGNEALVDSEPAVKNGKLLSSNVQLDYNLYYTPLGANDASAFIWNNTAYSSFAAYQSGSHQDAHSIFADPQFVDASANNFALASGSPAIGAGTSKTYWYAPKNFNGQTRSLPPNIGAY